MIKRIAEKELKQLANQFKSVAIVGPRQSGKTTLAINTFPDLPYVSLENPDTRRFALDDPRGFLYQYKTGVILDEAQRVPELFSYLQQILDETKLPGRFIITGSNNFLLQENISQSLAGRIAYIYLLPFSFSELPSEPDINVYDLVIKGFYPPVYDQPIDANKWYSNYIRTYIERDVRQLKNISNLNLFDRFIRLCAGRIGQLVNMNNLAIETGVDAKTIASWLGILESSFIIHRLQPHHANFNKRLVKMNKLYFYDTGLACNLLGITKPDQLQFHYMGGSIFENFIINELLKHRFNHGENNNLFFWRDNIGHEIDVIIETPNNLLPLEIKSGKTITPDYFKGLLFWQKISNYKKGNIIYAGNLDQKNSGGISVLEWKHLKNPELFFKD